MTLGNVARVTAVLAACVAAVGSASSSSNQPPPAAAAGYGNNPNEGPPPPQQMDPARALGLWRSTFGAVKIEADNSKGGLQTGALQGVWIYQRQQQEVVGYFSGSLRGNVLEFRWQEPSNPPLVGEGYLVFDVQGRQYAGRWWSERRDRVGDWNGWRQAAGPNDPNAPAGPDGADPNAHGQYGGAQYGDGGQGHGEQPAPPYSQPPAPQQPHQPPPPPRRYY